MLILSLETTGFMGGVAILEDGTLVGEVVTGSRNTYSRRLLGQVDCLFKELGLSFQDIDVIAVSLGPGSFTGLRIGLATAKGICLSTGARLMGIPTLDILAFGLVTGEPGRRLVCPLIDARRKQVYTALYAIDGLVMNRVKDPLVIHPGQLNELVPEDSSVIFLGNGLSQYRRDMERAFGNRALFSPEGLWHPRPANCALLAMEYVKAGRPFDDPFSIVPQYLRLSEAEENRMRGRI